MTASRSQQSHPRRLSFIKETGVIKERKSICSPLPDEQTHWSNSHVTVWSTFPLWPCVREGLFSNGCHVKVKRDCRIHQWNGRVSSHHKLPKWLLPKTTNVIVEDLSWLFLPLNKTILYVSIPIVYVWHTCVCVHVWTDARVGISDILLNQSLAYSLETRASPKTWS